VELTKHMTGKKREKEYAPAAVTGGLKSPKSYENALKEVALDHHAERQVIKIRRAVIDNLEG